MGTVSVSDEDVGTSITITVLEADGATVSSCFSSTAPQSMPSQPDQPASQFEADVTLADASCLNYEEVTDGRIELVIAVEDNNGLKANSTATIRVNDVNEIPATQDGSADISEDI